MFKLFRNIFLIILLTSAIFASQMHGYYINAFAGVCIGLFVEIVMWNR